MITSANAVNAINDRYTPDRRKALFIGGAASGSILGGAYGGRRALSAYMERHRERITGKPKMVKLQGKLRPSHGIKSLWASGLMRKQGRTLAVYEKHQAAFQKLNRILSHLGWRQARQAGALGLAATVGAAGSMALFPERRRR